MTSVKSDETRTSKRLGAGLIKLRSTFIEADRLCLRSRLQGFFLSPLFLSLCPPLLLGGGSGFGATTTLGGSSFGGGGFGSLCANALTVTMQSIMAVINIRFKFFIITCGLLMPDFT